MNTFNPSRCLPRFSVRTLIIVVTLVGLYFGAWELTKTAGTQAVARRLEATNINPSDLTSQAPFLVSAFEDQAGTYPQTQRRHHLWLVVKAVRLPQRFTRFVERLEDKWYAWTHDDQMTPQRVHGGVI